MTAIAHALSRALQSAGEVDILKQIAFLCSRSSGVVALPDLWPGPQPGLLLRPPHAHRHRQEHRPHAGRSRPAVQRDERAHPADRSEGAEEAEASEQVKEAAELFG
jgi:hypothetical protein